MINWGKYKKKIEYEGLTVVLLNNKGFSVVSTIYTFAETTVLNLRYMDSGAGASPSIGPS